MIRLSRDATEHLCFVGFVNVRTNKRETSPLEISLREYSPRPFVTQGKQSAAAICAGVTNLAQNEADQACVRLRNTHASDRNVDLEDELESKLDGARSAHLV